MIYFVEAEACKLIKIGFTGFRPDERFRVLQVGSPVRLTRLALMKGDKPREAKLHAEFSHHRSHGEWYRDSFTIRHFMATHAQPWIQGRTDLLVSDELKKARDAMLRAALDKLDIL